MGGEQPHAHIMFSNRELDGIKRPKEVFFKRANPKNSELGGAKKSREWSHDSRANDKLGQIREAWERSVNGALASAGLEIRIDRRSLEAQGIDRVPEPKMGPKVTQMVKNGVPTDRGAEVIEIRDFKRREREVSELKKELGRERTRVYDFSQAKEAKENVLILTKKKGDGEPVGGTKRQAFKRTVDLTMDRVETDLGIEYRWKRSGTVAFVDEGDRIIVRDGRNKTAVKATMQVAKEKGWEDVYVFGELHFRREAWLQGSLMGLNVTGYEEQERDRKVLRELRRKKAIKDRVHAKRRSQGQHKLLALEPKEKAPKREVFTIPAKDAAREVLYEVFPKIEAERERSIGEREALGYRGGSYPEPMTKIEAMDLAREDIGGKEFVQLKAEIEKLQGEMEGHEKSTKEFRGEVKELGYKAYFPRNASRIKRRRAEIERIDNELYPQYNERAKRYNKKLVEFEGPQAQAIKERAGEYLAADKDLVPKRELVEKRFASICKKEKDLIDLKRGLNKLGKQEVTLEMDVIKGRGVGVSVRPADKKQFEKQVKDTEIALRKERGRRLTR